MRNIFDRMTHPAITRGRVSVEDDNGNTSSHNPKQGGTIETHPVTTPGSVRMGLLITQSVHRYALSQASDCIVSIVVIVLNMDNNDFRFSRPSCRPLRKFKVDFLVHRNKVDKIDVYAMLKAVADGLQGYPHPP